MSKHTPGPWTTTENTFGVVSVDGIQICDVRGNGPTDETNEANGSLIASAPELLAALELITTEIRERTYVDGRMLSAAYVRGEVCSVATMNNAISAIRKAKGEQ